MLPSTLKCLSVITQYFVKDMVLVYVDEMPNTLTVAWKEYAVVQAWVDEENFYTNVTQV